MTIKEMDEKYRIVNTMFSEQGVNEELSVSSTVMLEFLKETSRIYNRRNNAFHNYDHGLTGIPHGLTQ